MDTKSLYIKTQKNLLLSGTIISGIIFLLSILPFTIQTSAKPSLSIDSWINLLTSAFIFTGLLYNRIKLKPAFAKTAMYIYILTFAYHLTNLILQSKNIYIQIQQSKILLTLTILIPIALMAGITYLYYKVYLATKNILILKNKND